MWLQALPMLSEAELPPAVGLVLKLASESPTARAPAVHCVRARVRSAAPGVAGGTLDAMRLAVLQHKEVASALLADIDAEARNGKAAPDSQVGRSCLPPGGLFPQHGVLHLSHLLGHVPSGRPAGGCRPSSHAPTAHTCMPPAWGLR